MSLRRFALTAEAFVFAMCLCYAASGIAQDSGTATTSEVDLLKRELESLKKQVLLQAKDIDRLREDIDQLRADNAKLVAQLAVKPADAAKVAEPDPLALGTTWSGSAAGVQENGKRYFFSPTAIVTKRGENDLLLRVTFQKDLEWQYEISQKNKLLELTAAEVVVSNIPGIPLGKKPFVQGASSAKLKQTKGVPTLEIVFTQPNNNTAKIELKADIKALP